MSRFRSRLLVLGAVVCGLAGPWGCEPSAGDAATLPPKDNLYEYSLAVAERARSLVGQDWWRPLYHIGNVHKRFRYDDRAIAHYKQALAINPDAAPAYLAIGFLLAKRNDMDEALAYYRKSLDADGDQAGVYTRMALVLVHKGELDEAKKVLDEEVRRGTADDVTYFNLGLALKLQEKYEPAVENYKRSVQINPFLREAYWGLFLSLAALGRSEEAEKYRAEFMKMKKEEDRHSLRAGYEGEKEKTDVDKARPWTAETWFEAYDLFSDVAQTLAGAVRSNVDSRNCPRCRKPLQNVRPALMPRPAAAQSTIEYLHCPACDRAGKATSYSHPRLDREKKAALEREYLAFGQECVRALEEVVRFDAKRVEAFSLLMNLTRERNPRKALEYGKQAVARFPADPRLYYEVGGLHLGVVPPEVDEGIRLLRRAVELAPDTPRTHLGLANALLKFGRTLPLVLEARKHAEKALELDENPAPDVFQILARACRSSGDSVRALEVIRQGLLRYPENEQLNKALRFLEDPRQRQGVRLQQENGGEKR